MNFNERTNTLLYKDISLALYFRRGWCFRGVCEMDGVTYTQREDLFFLSLLPGARGCQRLHPIASSSETLLIGCVFLARFNSQNSVKIWPRGFHHVTPFRLHTCSTWVPWLAVIFLFTNQNLTGYQSTRDHSERNENPCHMLYNISGFVLLKRWPLRWWGYSLAGE